MPINLKTPRLAVLVAGLSISAAGQSPRSNSTVRLERSRIDAYAREVDRFIERNPRKPRIFANTASGTTGEPDHWCEFDSENDREKADTGDNLNENAFVTLRAARIVAASFTFQSPSRDWALVVMYYFREDGTLAKIHAQLNTSYGDLIVVRDRYYAPDGKLLQEKTRFLDLESQKPRRPGKDYIDEPIPVFAKVSDLPFFKDL